MLVREQQQLTRRRFVNQSIQLNLFFLRIVKEHLIFVKASLTLKDVNYGRQADMLRSEVERLLMETVRLSQGVIRPNQFNSGEFVTKYTLDAEKATQFYTGIEIDTNITQMEISLGGSNLPITEDIEPENIPEDAPFGPNFDEQASAQNIFALNRRIIPVIREVIGFKETLIKRVASCQMFTLAYPHLVEHILDETRFYLTMLRRLQRMTNVDIDMEAVEQESFWNEIMGDHAEFIRGMLDPTETELINVANEFAERYDQLIEEAENLKSNMSNLGTVTQQSLRTTREFRNFKTQGVQGILGCKVKSIILPLLADHVLREANHYLRILRRLNRPNRY
ncbi:DUF2935 domain-containing protein [Clostridium sp. UBA4548]|uniref:DUF2935 domain-containing protein n=1 Tax=Clostridium sp. UBA4548 TaxID=1946361 RepID=UPI0025C018C6|nr:DUF2935 domain-containing protein [Clostridium sp. UBA4548]